MDNFNVEDGFRRYKIVLLYEFQSVDVNITLTVSRKVIKYDFHILWIKSANSTFIRCGHNALNKHYAVT